MTDSLHRRLQEKARELRVAVLEMCAAAGTGHVTSAFSCVEILVALYYGGILRHDPAQPQWPQRDRFILSKGQASVILYPILADRGFFPREWLASFAGTSGRFGVHLQHDIPGAEITSGSLGMGLGIAAGMALAARLDGHDHLVFALLGDGECYEGNVWESAAFAAHRRLNNLTAIIDRNYLAATGYTENMVHLEPLEQRWRAFGWDVQVIDGHSFREIFAALDDLRSRPTSRPLAVIARTVKGKGAPSLCHQPFQHAVAPTGERARQVLAEIMAEENR